MMPWPASSSRCLAGGARYRDDLRRSSRVLVEPFDTLVVDWMLLDLGGVRVVKRLRSADVGGPVLMLMTRVPRTEGAFELRFLRIAKKPTEPEFYDGVRPRGVSLT